MGLPSYGQVKARKRKVVEGGLLRVRCLRAAGDKEQLGQNVVVFSFPLPFFLFTTLPFILSPSPSFLPSFLPPFLPSTNSLPTYVVSRAFLGYGNNLGLKIMFLTFFLTIPYENSYIDFYQIWSLV